MSALPSPKFLIPALSFAARKGQAGRVGIVGGCLEYCGAPYYAAISALKMGCDLSHVFCSQEAAVPIKSMSPELMVHPYLRTSPNPDAEPDRAVVEQVVADVERWLPRMTSLVIGPGLGRDRTILESTKRIIIRAKELNMPMVIDADGLFIVSSDVSVIKGYRHAVLTPNPAEFGRIAAALKLHGTDTEPVTVQKLATELGHVTVFQKGSEDVISDGINCMKSTQKGSPRRCGGQGDVLSGAIGTFLSWMVQRRKDLNPHPQEDDTDRKDDARDGWELVAALGGSTVIRHAAHLAFQKHKRAMTTPDVLCFIGEAFEELYPCDAPTGGGTGTPAILEAPAGC